MLSTKVWEEKYKDKNELSKEDSYKRVAKAIMPTMYKDMCDNKFMPGGRILAGSGIDKDVTLANCFVLAIKDDTIEAIFECAMNAASTYKTGGGVGLCLSTLRPRGADVNNAARTSTGAVSFMELFDTTTKIIGGHGRRGALMLSLHVNHPDIMEFICVKDDEAKTAITNANISVMVSDEFMVAVEEDADCELWYPEICDVKPDCEFDNLHNISNCYDSEFSYYCVNGQFREKVIYKTVKAKDIWNAIILRAWSSAEPGVLFWSSMIEDNSTQSALPLASTNPCISKNNFVLTDEGYVQVKELIDKPFIAVYNDQYYDATGFFSTGVKSLYAVTLSDGTIIECTEDHKFYINKTDKIQVKELIGKQLLHNKFSRETRNEIYDSLNFQKGYLVGHVIGDGNINKSNIPIAQIWEDCGEKDFILKAYQNLTTDLKPEWKFRDYKGVESHTLRLPYMRNFFDSLLVTNENKHNLTQLYTQSDSFIIGVISSLIDADGSVQGTQNKGYSLRLNQSNYELLLLVKLWLSEYGVYSTLHKRREAGLRKLPDTNRDLKEYWCKANYELIISSKNLKLFYDSFPLINKKKQDKLKEIVNSVNFYNKKVKVKVKSIEYLREEEVYDCTVEEVHRYICNGVVISNCAEQPLPEFGACTLGSINLAAFVTDKFVNPHFEYDDFERVVALAVEFLDNTLDKANSPLPEQTKLMEDYRRIGLGVTGLAHCLAYLKISYDSDTAINFVSEIGKRLEKIAYQTSLQLAIDKGAYLKFNEIEGHLAKVINEGILDYDVVQEFGIRNSCLLTVAPSGTISLLMDTSYGIEPIYELSFTRNSESLSQKSFEVVDKAYEEYKQITGKTDIPDYFVTAYEVAPEKKVELQGALQEYIDSSISVTTNLPKDATVEDVANIYKLAWEKGCKGHTVYREGSRSAVLETNSSSLVRDSHEVLEGKTIVIPSRDGKVYLTINVHPLTQKPVEVFLSSAKSGSDVKAIYEGYGRVISLYLQTGGDIADIIATLLDINGKDTYFAKGWTLNSLPDLIAKGLLKLSDSVSIKLPCPECGSEITMTSGCMVCPSCGYSKC